MKIKTLTYFTLLSAILTSCSNQDTGEKSGKVKQPIVDSSNRINITEGLSESSPSENSESKPMFLNVELHDSSRKKIIQEIITKNLHTISLNNLLFLEALQYEDKSDWIFNRPLAPIYQFEKNKTGVVSEIYDNDSSREYLYLEKIRQTEIGNFTETDYAVPYPHLLNSINEEIQKPLLYYYSTSKIDSSKITNFRVFVGHCVDYFQYTLDTTKIDFQDSILFASSYKLDLFFGNNPKVDNEIVAYNKDNYSIGPWKGPFPFKTFARFKNIENLYFIYDDTFPLNEEFEPRALVYISDSKVYYLWYFEGLLYGCI